MIYETQDARNAFKRHFGREPSKKMLSRFRELLNEYEDERLALRAIEEEMDEAATILDEVRVALERDEPDYEIEGRIAAILRVRGD